MHNPKISIITITYNSEKTLEETIQSVIFQNYPNLEYLIIDGASTDGTMKIVEKYRNKISVVISEPDKGISDAFNKGIKYATGEIVGIINSDDLLLPGALQAIAHNYDPLIGVYRGRTIVWNDRTGAKITAYPTMQFPIYSLKKHIVCHQSTFVAKWAYEKYGCFREDFKYMMDHDLLIRFHQQGVRSKYIAEDLAVFRIGGVTSDRFTNKIQEYQRMYMENGANRLFAYLMTASFSCSQFLAMCLRKVITPDKIRRWKYGFYARQKR